MSGIKVGDLVCLEGDVAAGLPAGRVVAMGQVGDPDVMAVAVRWCEGEISWAFDGSPDGITVEELGVLRVVVR